MFQEDNSDSGGWWVLYQPEVHLGDDVVVPDLAGWRRRRLRDVPDLPWMSLAPDWACEIISPSTERLDRVHKLRSYSRAGVGHVWFVNPVAGSLEILRSNESEWTLAAAHGGDEVVRAEPFDRIELELACLWGSGPALDGPALSNGPTTVTEMGVRQILEQARRGSRNLRFRDVVRLVEALGFHLVRINGSHHIFSAPGIPELINLQDVRGQCKPYQVRQVLELADRYNLELEEE